LIILLILFTYCFRNSIHDLQYLFAKVRLCKVSRRFLVSSGLIEQFIRLKGLWPLHPGKPIEAVKNADTFIALTNILNFFMLIQDPISTACGGE
jgi:hypothetical protein